jgi:integrase
MAVYQKIRKDGSKAWYFDFMHNGVRYRGLGGATRTQAQRVMDKKRNEVLGGAHGLEGKANNPTIEKFAEKYLLRRQHLRSKQRDEISAKHLTSHFKGKTLLAIKSEDIEDYIVKRKGEGISNSTINRELACLKRMFSLAIKWGDAKFNPVKDVDFLEEPPGRTRYLTEQEAMDLLDASSPALRPIVFTALNTGMRLNEILSLTWDRVHLESSIEPYIELDATKNNKKRFIPLNDDMIAMMENLKGRHPQYVFIGQRGKPVREIRTPFANALDKAGIQNFKFHDLRHTFASHFVMSGGDLLTLKELLGHSSLQMVMRYAHLASAHKRKLINNLSGKFTNPDKICHLFATAANH